jgi:excisionase family DNA binding protein
MSAVELLRDGALGLPEASAFTGLGRSKLYELMDSGRLAYVKEGTRRLIPKRALQELLASCLIGGPAAAEPDQPAKPAKKAGRQ